MLVAFALLTACAAEEPPVAETSLAQLQWNQLQWNQLNWNALTFNGLNLGNGLASVELADPTTHQFVEYLVSCALPADQVVLVGGSKYAGGAGLAPEWAEGDCSEDCQRWVSACLLARVNARGERVQISMRGPHPALEATRREVYDFTHEEGTYYGNLFVDRQARWATSAREDLALPRTCGRSIDGCYVDVTGQSDDVCESGSRAWGREGCHDGNGAIWPQAITVYLK